MPHLWINKGGEWRARMLDAAWELPEHAALIRSRPDAAPACWLLLCGPAARAAVNGETVAPLGVRVLADRDEIRLGAGEPVYFTTESLPVVEPFPGVGRSLDCPRCTRPLAGPAVACPRCGLWFHQDGEFLCWTYAASCPGCSHPTALDAGFRWTPAEPEEL